MCLNTKTPAGREALEKLIAEADIFITNWRQNPLKKAGLDYDTLHARYPKLVYGFVSGYGEKGPDKDLPGFDFTAFFARGGILGTLFDRDALPMLTIAGFGDHQVGMYLAMSRQADREGYPEIAEAYKRYAWEEAEHASKFAELIGEVVWDTKTNLEKRMNAECGACEDKMRLARMAKEQNLDAVHDTVHEMAKDEARHGKGFEGLYKRYFGK